jgi:hypothetical protein
MLGPLPRLHRLLLVTIALAFCIGAGAWLAIWTPIPLVATAGATAGALVGVLVAYLLAHDFSDHDPRPVHIRRH